MDPPGRSFASPFSILSDDKIYEICEKLDDQSLSKFVRSSEHIRSVCQPILNERYGKLSEKEKQDIFIRKLDKISEKIQNREKPTMAEIRFYAPYDLEISKIQWYLKGKLRNKNIDPENKQRYRDLLLLSESEDFYFDSMSNRESYLNLFSDRELYELVYEVPRYQIDPQTLETYILYKPYF